MADHSEDDDENVGELDIIAPDEMMVKGLLFARYTEESIQRCKDSTNLERFVSRYGSSPIVLCAIWEDLQRSDNPDCHIPPDKLKLEYFLMSMHFLRRYPTEHERAAATGFHRDTCRDWTWYYVYRIQQLKHEVISFPADFGPDIWILTVDGTHCWVHEPNHPEFSQDSEYYSHKYNKAGLCYELAMSLKESRLIWMNGPFKAGESDLQIFRNQGLRDKLRSMGKKGIADGGYHAEEDFDVLSCPNNIDSAVVKKFKRRALKRQEKFNGMTKAFECLSSRFDHPIQRFAPCFEAVSVICQYQMRYGTPLYNILIEGM